MQTRLWTLARVPGALSIDDFAMRTVEIDETLAPGEVIVRHAIFLCTPAMRGWMDPQRSRYVPAIDVGDPVVALAGSVVVASADAAFPVGARVTCVGQWAEHQKLNIAAAGVQRVPADMTLREAVGVYSVNMLTGYFGLLRVGEAKAGETVLVSGAAGSTGSAVMQIARIKGCRTIGIAGGKAKCDWLLSECGADAVIDYRNADVGAELARIAPDGVDVFYDNIGGDILQAGVDNMARLGRVVLCGQIQAYDSGAPAAGIRDMMQLVYGSMKMQGFLMGDYADEIPAARAELKGWVDSGLIHHREDIGQGFDRVPTIYARLFAGANEGTLLAEIDTGAACAKEAA